MTRNFLAIALIFSIMALACNDEAGKDGDADCKDTLKAEKTTAVDLETIYANPGEYVDKEVYVEGLVDHICKHGGKKIFMVQDDKSIRIHGTEPFEEGIVGTSVIVKAVFKEDRIDSTYLAEWEAEVRKTHEGEDAEGIATLEKIQNMKDSIGDTEKGFVSNYYMDFVAFPKDSEGCDTHKEKDDVKKQPVSGGCD